MTLKIFSLSAASLLAAFLTGCVGDILTPREDPTQFYVLNGAVNPERIEGLQEIPLNVSLVRIPSYMTRNQIVTRQGGTRIDISDINRWPEMPVDSFTRVISSNLARMAQSDQIYTYPSLALGIGAPELRVNVLDCMGELGGDLYFSARWEIIKAEGATVVKRKTDIFETKIPAGNTYDSYVKAIEKALYELSLDIAKNLREFK